MHSLGHCELLEFIGAPVRDESTVRHRAAIRSPDLPCVHDESLRRVPDIGERVTGHERQIAPRGRREHANIRRAHDPGFRDGIPRHARRCLQSNHVIRMNRTQRAEVRVPMRGDSDVAVAGGNAVPECALPLVSGFRRHRLRRPSRTGRDVECQSQRPCRRAARGEPAWASAV